MKEIFDNDNFVQSFKFRVCHGFLIESKFEMTTIVDSITTIVDLHYAPHGSYK